MANINNTDEAQLALVQQAFDTAMSTMVVESQHVVAVGTPHEPEIREVRPVAEQGLGFRPASETDPR